MIADDRTGKDGHIDQKGVELGAKNYDVNSYLDREPSVTIAIFQLRGSNALSTATAIRERMEQLRQNFPKKTQADGTSKLLIEEKIVYDTTVFIDESIHEGYKTLFEAFIQVFVVVLVFLQDWRATLLPMIDVPVSLIGTFAIMALMGFSLNNLSLFGLVLAIGIFHRSAPAEDARSGDEGRAWQSGTHRRANRNDLGRANRRLRGRRRRARRGRQS